MRKPVMAANWKLYKTAAETTTFFEKFLPLVQHSKHCEIVVCPVFVNLPAAVEAVRGSNVRIGAQNLFWENEGAYTGEVSGPMIAAVGCSHVVVGHSERRQYFGETDLTVLKRTRAALDAGLTPIVCLGETLEQREAGRTAAVLVEQFTRGIAELSPKQFSAILIAYEPVWAIGTGRTATPEIAADAHRVLRDQARTQFGEEAAESLRILYGGSVKPDNVKGLMAQLQIDGALVGGASLKPETFAPIVNF
jgi:triosephosphate isomerase (TIM)